MFLGIDLSHSDVAAIVADANGQPQMAMRAALSPSDDTPALWNRALDTARQTLQRANIAPATLSGVALAMDVPFDARGLVQRGPHTEGWDGFDVPRALRESLGVANARAENRAVCAALGEARYGVLRATTDTENAGGDSPEETARGALIGSERDWLYLHIGARLGACACLDGQLLRGQTRRALDIGAICIDRDGPLGSNGLRGSLEAFCGGDNFLARAAGYGLTPRTALEVWEMAPQNFAARSVCDDFIRRLAQGIGTALALLDVPLVVLGGTLPHALGETLLTPLRLALGEFWRAPFETGAAITRSPQIKTGLLGGDAAALGAVAVAMQKGEYSH